MSQERLNGLAILSIEKNTVKTLDYEDLISTFAAKSARRVMFKWSISEYCNDYLFLDDNVFKLCNDKYFVMIFYEDYVLKKFIIKNIKRISPNKSVSGLQK